MKLPLKAHHPTTVCVIMYHVIDWINRIMTSNEGNYIVHKVKFCIIAYTCSNYTTSRETVFCIPYKNMHDQIPQDTTTRGNGYPV